jgi:hypothetical protein
MMLYKILAWMVWPFIAIYVILTELIHGYE